MTKKRRGRRALTCGKVRYRDHAEAVRALELIRTQGRTSDGQAKPYRSYPCDVCKGHHLSSHDG